jgi:hypothetical protein
MTLPVAPSSIAFDQINTELGNAPNFQFAMNNAPARALAGVPVSSSQIAMSNFYGKSAVPPVGCFYCGGYYVGSTSSEPSGQTYYLIAAPLPQGTTFPGTPTAPSPCAWRPNTSPCPIPAPLTAVNWNNDPTTNSSQDGYNNTTNAYNAPASGAAPACASPCLNNTTPAQGSQYPLFTWAKNLSICGYSDWYIPSCNEIQQSVINGRYILESSGQGYPHQLIPACAPLGFPCLPACYPIGCGSTVGVSSTQCATPFQNRWASNFNYAYCRPYPGSYCPTATTVGQKSFVGTTTSWARAVRRQPC